MSTPAAPDAPLLVVRYNRVLGLVSCVVGVLMLALGVGTDDTLNVVLGALLTVIGLSYVLGKALVLMPTELQVKSPLGITTRRIPLGGPTDLSLDGKTLVHVPEDRKVVTLGFGIDRGDVERLRSLVGDAGAR